jgi:hypothetical protein
MNVGYVAMDPAHPRHVDVQGQVGGGGWLPHGDGGGGSTMHIEPFVARKVSLPIGAGVGASPGQGMAPFRFGVRHRPLSFLAYGAGIGPSLVFDRHFATVSGNADIELVLGLQRRVFGFSVGIRPTLAFPSSPAWFYFLVDPTLAIAVTPHTSVTLAIPFGLQYVSAFGGATAFMTGALGLHRRF